MDEYVKIGKRPPLPYIERRTLFCQSSYPLPSRRFQRCRHQLFHLIRSFQSEKLLLSCLVIYWNCRVDGMHGKNPSHRLPAAILSFHPVHLIQLESPAYLAPKGAFVCLTGESINCPSSSSSSPSSIAASFASFGPKGKFST